MCIIWWSQQKGKSSFTNAHWASCQGSHHCMRWMHGWEMQHLIHTWSATYPSPSQSGYQKSAIGGQVWDKTCQDKWQNSAPKCKSCKIAPSKQLYLGWRESTPVKMCLQGVGDSGNFQHLCAFSRRLSGIWLQILTFPTVWAVSNHENRFYAEIPCTFQRPKFDEHCLRAISQFPTK